MPVAQYQGQITVPLWAHPFSNPFTTAIVPNVFLGTMQASQITPTAGGGYSQPAIATWRGRSYTLISNTGNTNIGHQNQLSNQTSAVYKQRCFWIGAGSTYFQSYNVLGVPDKQGTVTRYPASNPSYGTLAPNTVSLAAPGNTYSFYGSASGDPAFFNMLNYSPSLGYYIGFLVQDVLNTSKVAAYLTTMGDTTLGYQHYNGVIGSARYSTDDTFMLSFNASYPNRALINFNYTQNAASGQAATQSPVSFDTGANFWTNGTTGVGVWNEANGGFVYTNQAALNNAPYTAVFVSQDFTKWWQIILVPQDATSATLVSTLAQSAYCKLMLDDQGTWFLTGKSPNLSIAVSLPPAGSSGPTQQANTANVLPTPLPCVDIC